MISRVLMTCLVCAALSECFIGMELRCQCINRESRFMKPRQIKNIELIPKGPHCAQAEVIASLKSGHHICLDPSAAWVKIVIQKVLKR
ncbi:interleukin-8-like [Polyodon spathula]|uniref:interleukin-8-like n=1 Tax=Polyodon spathula TaxID=7913 RepID=UPI001B7EB197|nr:interleukin-8-like [Polyodon spathula]